MATKVQEAASANAEFVRCVILRAADMVAEPRGGQHGRTPAIEALRQARDEFLPQETKGQKKLRTYHWGNLVNDVKWFLVNREGADPDSLSPITQWEHDLAPAIVADKLREAAQAIADVTRENTMVDVRLGAMSDDQLGEYVLMQKTAEFLRQHGLEVALAREWEDPNAPLDYRGTVDGAPWAFELTELRKDPGHYHRKVGHPKGKKNLKEQLEELERPLPQVPDGQEALQENLDKAVEHGMKKSKKKALDGAKYCLVVHNQQFLFAPDWQEITWPDLGEFDAVVIFHDQMLPPARVWQVMPQDAFGRPVTSKNVEDLEILALEQQGRGPDPEVVKKAWQRLDELGITEGDFLDE